MPRRNFLVLLFAVFLSFLCYQRAARNRYADTLTKAMNIIKTSYIHEVDPRVLFEGAIDGMIGKLDPYSAYTSPEEFNQFQQQMEGEFVGVGIEIDPEQKEGGLTVLHALVGMPAYLAGIRAGDVILAIDGQETKDVPFRDSVRMIRGKLGTKVKLRIQTAGGGAVKEYTLERATIPLETVRGDGRGADGKWVFRLASQPRIGFIRIFDSFGERTAEEFRAALATYRQPGQEIDGLVIDLRYNRGGLLPAATEVCDMLLDGGLIVTTRGRNGQAIIGGEVEAQPGTELPPDVPIVVLVDRLSASASEIVAACLQDHHRAAIAGQRTWGKGTVQNVIKLEGGKSAIRLTIGTYHRPSGQEIHKWKDAQESDQWGVRPDSGLETLLTNHQNDLILLTRRRRDQIPWEELAGAPANQAVEPATQAAAEPSSKADAAATDSNDPPVPSPQADDEGQAAAATPALEEEAAKAASGDPTVVDPQLRKAVEYLEEQIGGSAKGPGRA
jgi:carboxyl-terminal processing protease